MFEMSGKKQNYNLYQNNFMMSNDIGVVEDKVSATVVKRPTGSEGMKAGGVFTVVCHDAQGNFKWEDTFHNLVTNQGAAYMNQTFFKIGRAHV